MPSPAPNHTGLPDALKASVEALSGLSLDDVRVHRNSAHPTQLHAFAYAQGSEIHLPPGQEKHLPHEHWHLIHHTQGRVAATPQLKSTLPIHDDPSLEQEAEALAAKALRDSSAATKA